MTHIGLVPDCRHVPGGPASFEKKLERGFLDRSLRPCYDLKGAELDALLVINATKHLSYLWRAKRRGVPIVQRLGAPFPSSANLRVSLTKRMRIWLGTRNIAYIRSHVADRVVYQSHFVRDCWNRVYGKIDKPSKVIYNGVDLSHFCPDGPKYQSHADVCIVSVEGTQRGPDDHPALLVAESLKARGLDVELLLFGKPFGDTAGLWANYPLVQFRGLVPNADLPFFYRGSTLYILTDIVNAGCPNSVIEALACGTPVLGYGVGVLPEMLDSCAGRCVLPKGDPWRGEHAGNIDGLADAALEIIENNASYRVGARCLAENQYGLDTMVNEYVDFLRSQA